MGWPLWRARLVGGPCLGQCKTATLHAVWTATTSSPLPAAAVAHVMGGAPTTVLSSLAHLANGNSCPSELPRHPRPSRLLPTFLKGCALAAYGHFGSWISWQQTSAGVFNRPSGTSAKISGQFGHKKLWQQYANTLALWLNFNLQQNTTEEICWWWLKSQQRKTEALIDNNYQKPHVQTSQNFQCMLPAPVAQSFSGSIAVQVNLLLVCGWHHIFAQWAFWCCDVTTASLSF